MEESVEGGRVFPVEMHAVVAVGATMVGRAVREHVKRHPIATAASLVVGLGSGYVTSFVVGGWVGFGIGAAVTVGSNFLVTRTRIREIEPLR